MQEVEFRIHAQDLENKDALLSGMSRASGIPKQKIRDYKILRRSLDARFRPPQYQFRAIVSDQLLTPEKKLLDALPDVSTGPEVHIIGSGPAGYFAALQCIINGLRPVVIERGKDVQTRRRDLRAIQQEGLVNPDSNYCFGEGGAGTYSDGKLYTRSNKRGNIQEILGWLVECGADPEILVDAHPHIGSNKLPGIIAKMRELIESRGGEVKFDTRLTDLVVDNTMSPRITHLILNDGERIAVNAVILATGHSARDIFEMMQRHSIRIELKSFALGVRIEHPQPFVDACQYGLSERGKFLPAASYSLASQFNEKGVFSFCMCPGGLVVPAATSPGEIVVNGMSLSRRDSPFANSGVVTTIDPNDIIEFAKGKIKADDPMAGVWFQQQVEQTMFNAGDGSQKSPGQRLPDFLKRVKSKDLPETSYIPGVHTAPVSKLLPSFVYQRIAGGVKLFDQKMQGYVRKEALVLATESRTSSPIRIPRDPETGMHIEVEGLFPCGEGAGYAGGIVSAAMDGVAMAKAVSVYFTQNNKRKTT